MFSKEGSKVFKIVESSIVIKSLLIFPMTPFYFSVVTGCIGSDVFLFDSGLFQYQLKQRQVFFFSGTKQPLREFHPIICLNATK